MPTKVHDIGYFLLERFVRVGRTIRSSVSVGRGGIVLVQIGTEAVMTPVSSVAGMLGVFDVKPVGQGRFSGFSDGGERGIVDGTQLLAQSIVAVAKQFPTK